TCLPQLQSLLKPPPSHTVNLAVRCPYWQPARRSTTMNRCPWQISSRTLLRYSDQGVIPIDNTLIDRDGMLIPDAGWYWDHAEERNKIAQDYLFANYVCTSDKHYPLEFRLFPKKEVCEALVAVHALILAL